MLQTATRFWDVLILSQLTGGILRNVCLNRNLEMRLVKTFLTLSLTSVFLSAPVSAQTSREAAELSMRVDRLEAQIRELTGQVERLTFALQNNSGAAQPTAPLGSAPMSNNVQPAPSASGLGAPPANLGTLSGSTATSGEGGPLDLSALIGASGGLGVDPILPDATTAASTVPGGDARAEYELAYGHILRGDYQTAEASLRQFLAEHPNDPLVSDARFWLGESLFVRGSYRDAASEFLEAYSKYPQNAKAPDSLLKLGLSLRELGETEAACATFAELVRKYPAASPPVKQRVRDERKSAKCI